MGISAGVGIGDLLGSLFFPAAAADLGVEAGLGAAGADLGLAGAGATAGVTDLAGAGALAGGADLGLEATAPFGAGSTLAGVDTGATTAADALASGVAGGAGLDVGAEVGAPFFSPTAADASASAAAAGAGGMAPGTTTGLAGAPGMAATTPIASPSTILAGNDANIAADLGGEATAALPDTAPTAAQTAAAGSTPAAAADAAAGEATAPFGSGSTLSPGTNSVLANGTGMLGKIGSFLSNPLTQLAVPGGMLAYNLLKGPAPIPPQAQQAVNNATQNVPMLNNLAATDLARAENNQISPSQAAQLSIQKQDLLNQLYQNIANQGVTNPTATSEWVSGKAQIDAQILAQQQQFIDQMISTAFQAQGAVNAADQTLMDAAKIQTQNDTNFNNALIGAMESFSFIAALNSGKLAKAGAALTS